MVHLFIYVLLTVPLVDDQMTHTTSLKFICQMMADKQYSWIGSYYLTGLVHVSEVSWDLVQDVRDFLNEGDQVRVKVIHIDR